MFFANSSREELRRRYVEAWRRHREGLPLEPLDAQVADVVALHPEYHALLEAPDALTRDFTVEQGQVNPFLHMGLHLGVREQVATNRPAGITEVHRHLSQRLGSTHEAEHRMVDVLAETLWEAQRSGRAPDEAAYLDRLRRL
ncbi:MAG: DUF1841 family protein [Pseudomonadota bacterium]|jgi:hypothetical protein|nr:MAG: DUF1841 domain-containing protein [Pseudomonadota bacterium]